MAELGALVSAENVLVGRFIDVLRREQAVLQRGDAGALPALLTEKSALVDELVRVAGERNRALGQAGLGSDQAGMSAWLEGHPAEVALRKAWGRLLELAVEARELHRQNGQLIQIHLQNTQDAITVLHQAARKQQLYGPDGQSSPQSGHHIIDSA